MTAVASTDASAPDWLLNREVALCPCGCIGKRRKGSYVEKTLTGGADLLRQVMFSDDTSEQSGLLQRIDPRVKLVSLFGLLVVGALLHSIPALLVLYASTLVLAASSALPLGFFVKRVWLFVPIFTGFVLIPATLSIVTRGDVILTLWHWNGQPQGITQQGLVSALLVICRVASSISLVILLTLTTPWTRLLASLRALGVPRMFVLIIGMAYRYLFLLLGTVTDMYEARKARTVGAEKHDGAARKFVFASAGALIGKSLALSEEVHQAMVSRGYRGDVRVLTQSRPARAELLFAAGVAAFGAALLIGERFLVG
ncbi:cobalt ECF transporter T component CbiQ [Mycolicibacterium komossense]|uniref:Cobalt ECF transporter T component CbiQ n=1 Tax=Mycolicibacterium komossense TaxID=1779 RepID=A0ABT3CAZ4_9MYCO|nr:cobalt ECF transporter T component CbiQ [Mycolicibacterium komossense]MCV7226650.1 cobalt ECF transporter T component CbiQ [Mycolicibacterium komossense]